jgi:dipeptidase E
MGGGGFSMEPRNPRLDRWLLSLTGRRTPRVLFVPTASGDAARYIARFHRAFAKHACTHEHLPLFGRTVADFRALVLRQHLIYVGGGNTANLLAVWRTHGLDAILREAWEAGVVLCGVSAGAICWFEAGVTDSFGPALQPLPNALGFLPGSFCPHYDGDAQRRPAFRAFLASGALPSGHAADDGAALLFEGSTLADVVASRRNARGYAVTHEEERALATRRL